MARRPNLDLIGHWLFFAALPWLLALPFRLARRLWRGKPATKKPGEVKDFYQTAAYRRARIECMKSNIDRWGALTCQLCGRTKREGVRLFHCHHVKSRSNWPELALDPTNLEMLCEACNLGMGARYEDLKLTRCRRAS